MTCKYDRHDKCMSNTIVFPFVDKFITLTFFIAYVGTKHHRKCNLSLKKSYFLLFVA